MYWVPEPILKIRTWPDSDPFPSLDSEPIAIVWPSDEDEKNNVITTKDETNYNFEQILNETELSDNKQNLDGKNLHDLYRHSTKLIKWFK